MFPKEIVLMLTAAALAVLSKLTWEIQYYIESTDYDTGLALLSHLLIFFAQLVATYLLISAVSNVATKSIVVTFAIFMALIYRELPSAEYTTLIGIFALPFAYFYPEKRTRKYTIKSLFVAVSFAIMIFVRTNFSNRLRE